MRAIGKRQHSDPGTLGVHRGSLPPSSGPQSLESVSPESSPRCASLAPQAGSVQPGTPPRPVKRLRSQLEGGGNPIVPTSVVGSVPEPATDNNPTYRWEDLPGDIWTKIMENLRPRGSWGPLVESCRAIYDVWSAVDSSFQKDILSSKSFLRSHDFDKDKNGKHCCRDGKPFVEFIRCDWTQKRLVYADDIWIGGLSVQAEDMAFILRTVAERANNLQDLTVKARAQNPANSLVKIGQLSRLSKLKSLVMFLGNEKQMNDEILHQVGKLTYLERFAAIDGSSYGTYGAQQGAEFADWTPEGLKSLTRLRGLRRLELDLPSRVPGALPILASMTSLEEVFIRRWPGLAESVLRATLEPLRNLSRLICRVDQDGTWVLIYFDYSKNTIAKEDLPEGDIWSCGVRR